MSSIGFDGCVKDVQFDATIWDLNKNTRALGVLPGCPAKVKFCSEEFKNFSSLLMSIFMILICNIS